MHAQLSDTEFQDVLGNLRRFIQREVIPREREIADADEVPEDLLKAIREMGLFGYAIPTQWGGLGLSLSQEVELLFELSYTSIALRSLVGTNNGIAGQVLVNYGTAEQQKTWLAPIAAGDLIASFALTEEGAGSNPGALRSLARRTTDGWVLSGNKRFITNAPIAGLFMVFARAEDSPHHDSSTIAAFLVPADAPGLTVGPKDKKMGQEGAWTADVNLDQVRLPDSALVGGDVQVGYRAAMASLAKGRVHIAATAVGQARRALDESARYAATARQGDHRIGDFQLVQSMLANQKVGVEAGTSLVRDTARRYDTGEDTRVGPSVAKHYCTEMVGRVADLGVQIHGGYGYMRETVVERIYRDVRLMRLYEGTTQIQEIIIGSSMVAAADRS